MPLTNVGTAIVIIFGLYVAAGVLLYMFQARLIYHRDVPSRSLATTPDVYGLEYEDVVLETQDGVRLHGWFIPSTGEPRGVVLFFHGNAGNISHRLDSVKTFHALAYYLHAMHFVRHIYRRRLPLVSW